MVALSCFSSLSFGEGRRGSERASFFFSLRFLSTRVGEKDREAFSP